MGSVSIPLTQGQVTFIDEGDTEIVSPYKWCAFWNGRRYYALSNMNVYGKRKNIYLHRFLLSAPQGAVVDHVNGDGLDNRRSNLRLATVAQNAVNSGKRIDAVTSQFKGVHFNPKCTRRPWIASGSLNGKKTYLGSFATEIEAAEAYNAAMGREFGAFARMNNNAFDDLQAKRGLS